MRDAPRLRVELAEHESARDESAFLAADVAVRLQGPLRPLVKAREEAERTWQRSRKRLQKARGVKA